MLMIDCHAHIYSFARSANPGNADLPIGGLDGANQEIGVPGSVPKHGLPMMFGCVER